MRLGRGARELAAEDGGAGARRACRSAAERHLPRRVLSHLTNLAGSRTLGTRRRPAWGPARAGSPSGGRTSTPACWTWRSAFGLCAAFDCKNSCLRCGRKAQARGRRTALGEPVGSGGVGGEAAATSTRGFQAKRLCLATFTRDLSFNRNSLCAVRRAFRGSGVLRPALRRGRHGEASQTRRRGTPCLAASHNIIARHNWSGPVGHWRCQRCFRNEKRPRDASPLTVPQPTGLKLGALLQ